MQHATPARVRQKAGVPAPAAYGGRPGRGASWSRRRLVEAVATSHDWGALRPRNAIQRGGVVLARHDHPTEEGGSGGIDCVDARNRDCWTCGGRPGRGRQAAVAAPVGRRATQFCRDVADYRVELNTERAHTGRLSRDLTQDQALVGARKIRRR